MSYARAFSKIDTWITEYSVTANFGLTPVLEVWNKINDRRDDRKEWARILMKFGLTSLSAGRIINIGVDFTIVPAPDANFAEALMNTILLLQRQFDTARTNFNDDIVISELISLVQSQKSVLSVPEFNIVNKVGTINSRGYSNTSYNILANTTSGILSFGMRDVWELKYPNFDIIGRTADQSTAAAQGVAGGSAGGGY